MRLAIVVVYIGSALLFRQVCAQTADIERFLQTAKETTGKEKIIALADVCKTFYSIDPQQGIAYGEQALHLSDSLKIPSAKSRVYNAIGVNYWALSDFVTARLYYDSAFQNAILFRDSFELGMYYNRMGLMYESMGHFDSCLLVFRKEMDIQRKLNNQERLGTVLENLGTIHLNRGEYKTAISYLLEAKATFESTGILNKSAYVYLKLGQIYSELKDFNAAEACFRKGVEQSLEIKDLMKAGMGYNAIGILYKNQGKYDTALVVFAQALETIKNLNNQNLTISIYGNIGNVYTSLEKYPEALVYHRKALHLASQIQRPLNIAIQQFNLGQDYFFLKEFQHARTLYESALPAFAASKSQSNLLAVYKGLIAVNDSLQDHRETVKYYELYLEVKDSLTKHELNTALDSLRVKFHTTQTEQENRLLKQETELKNKTISLQRTLMISAFILVALLISLAVVIVHSRRKMQKANKLLGIINLDVKAKAEELERINKKLIELSKFKDSMNSFLVHDLKNPLNTIINVDAGGSSEQMVEIIRQSGRQMLNIVLNLLDVSKYEDKELKLSPVDISVMELIQRANSDVRLLADQKSIPIRLNVPDDCNIHADPEIIERVFVNLFSNAIKFSPPGGTIQVDAEMVGQAMIRIVVKDNGTGIPAEFQPYIFDKFTQFQKHRSGLTGSTGIGLTFCKMAIEAHGGEIGVESAEGKGASFWLTLPLAGTQPGLIKHPDQVGEKADSSDANLLTPDEIARLAPVLKQLQKIRVFQVSDVKEILRSIDTPETPGIATWKSNLLNVLSECNQHKYNELINLHHDVR